MWDLEGNGLQACGTAASVSLGSVLTCQPAREEWAPLAGLEATRAPRGLGSGPGRLISEPPSSLCAGICFLTWIPECKQVQAACPPPTHAVHLVFLWQTLSCVTATLGGQCRRAVGRRVPPVSPCAGHTVLSGFPVCCGGRGWEAGQGGASCPLVWWCWGSGTGPPHEPCWDSSGVLRRMTRGHGDSWQPFSSCCAPCPPADEQGVERLEAQAQLPLRWTQQLPDPAEVSAGRRVSSLVPEAWGVSSGRPH